MELLRCPLCQYELKPDGDSGCASCGLVKNCSLIKCPNCGYEFVEKSGIILFFARLYRWIRKFGRRTHGKTN